MIRKWVVSVEWDIVDRIQKETFAYFGQVKTMHRAIPTTITPSARLHDTRHTGRPKLR